MRQPQNVAIISDSASADFARGVIARWQAERDAPAFTLLNAEFWDSTCVVSGDIALIAPLPRGRMEPVLRSLAAAGTAALTASNDPDARHWARSVHRRALVLPPQDAWADPLVELGTEMLARVAAEQRAREAERLAAIATLGRYALEMRHAFNNAMTSLLGNAELLLMAPNAFPAPVSEQLGTIRAMALRLNQMMQRFSSLEAEMEIAQNGAAAQKTNAHAVASHPRED